jgi:Bax protein
MKNNQDLFEQRSKNNLLKIILSSFLTVSFFYIAPIFINFADKNFYTKELQIILRRFWLIHLIKKIKIKKKMKL